MVPLMVLALDKTQHIAEGTSLLAIIPTAITGVVFHRRRQLVAFRYAATMGLGGVFGAFLGAVLALRMDAGTLQLVFGAFLALIALRTIWEGIKDIRADQSGGPPDTGTGSTENQPPSTAAPPGKA